MNPGYCIPVGSPDRQRQGPSKQRGSSQNCHITFLKHLQTNNLSLSIKTTSRNVNKLQKVLQIRSNLRCIAIVILPLI